MKIAFIVNQFPVLSETFILKQITDLIERGHEVDIYADEPSDNSQMHPDVENYHLLERTYYAGRLSNPFLWTLKRKVWSMVFAPLQSSHWSIRTSSIIVGDGPSLDTSDIIKLLG